MDYFVAKSQVERCLAGYSGGIPYALTLSSDAAPQIERLFYDGAVPDDVKAQAAQYFERYAAYYDRVGRGWQRFNLSAYRLEQIYAELPK